MDSPVAHLHWGADALWQSLERELPGISVEVLAQADSTNTRLLERARTSSGDPGGRISRSGELDAQARAAHTPHGRRAGDISPCLLVAEHQGAGRGRMGQPWLSSAGASLTFSLALALEPPQWGGLSLAVGLALAEALDPLPTTAAAPRLVLKWPNDLWLREGAGRGRKLGGILIETVSVGQRRVCVVGVGLNVLPLPAGATAGLAHGYACLQEIDPAASAPGALARVAPPLVRALKLFEAQGFAPLRAAYARRDLLLGQAVRALLPQPLEGVAEGVDEHGALLLRADELRRVISGEVSVRLA